MSKCFIFGALPARYTPELPEKGDLVIAADKGYERLKEIGIKPDMLVGDFDSLGYIPDFENTVKLHIRKDETDVARCVDIALYEGYRDIVIYGACGGKLDHSIANIGLCSYILDRGGKAVFYGDSESFTVIDSSFHFDKRERGRLSVFSLFEESRGVSITGASYEAVDITLSGKTTLGVSNAFIGKSVDISVSDGELLIIWETVSIM